MDLTNEDVADVLALLDSLPYDSFDLQTSQFRLTLRRAAGGWTEESQLLASPAVLTSPTGPTSPAGLAEPTGLASAPGALAAPRSAPASAVGGAAGPPPAPPASAPARPGGTTRDGTTEDGDAAADGGLAVVTAPLPGTFYRAPRPGADPFVQVGDAVAADTVVAIVETMKLMNPVHAGTAGRVAQFALENGDFAPLGTPLMLIEPA